MQARTPGPVPCTIGILTFNSADVLPRALDATESFVERIVCDGGSTDGTVELARRRGCVVLRQEQRFQRPDGWLLDFAGAMNQMLDASTQPWFFKVDSDEVPSPALVQELCEVLVEPSTNSAYVAPMKYQVDGVEIESASTYPMRQLRVVRTGVGLAYGRSVHEEIDVSMVEVGTLVHPIHLPQWPARVLASRWWRYLRIEVDRYVGDPLSVRWKTGARRHARAVRHLARATVRARRSGTKPSLPLRYEVLRITNHAVGVGAILGAPALGRHDPEGSRRAG